MTTDRGIGGLSLGLGGWVNSKLAITARIAGATASISGGSVTDAFVGPSVQYWIDDDHFWVGGGVGFGVFVIRADSGESRTITGASFDVRAGDTLNAGSKHTVNFSLELTPGRVRDDELNASLSVMSIGALIGYQFL